MKDTLTKKSTYYDTHIKTSETVRNDINGIYKELIEYNKLQRQEKAGVSSDTIYTVKITLFIFILGIFIERLIKFADKKNKDTDQKKFFLFHLNQANNLLFKKLKEVYKKLHDDISIDTGLESTPPKVISSDFQRLLNLNHEELFKAYKNKNVLSKILGQIEFVDKIQIEVNKFHDRVLQDSGNLRDNLENQSDEYLSLLSRYIEWEKLNNLQCENSQTYILINNLVFKYYKELSGTRQLSVFYQDIIRVIQSQIVESGEYKTHHLLTEVAEKGRKLSHLVTKLTAKTKEIADQYYVFSNYMESANKELNKLIPDLK